MKEKSHCWISKPNKILLIKLQAKLSLQLSRKVTLAEVVEKALCNYWVDLAMEKKQNP